MTIAAERLLLWREHPAQMVRDLFDIEPDAWQEDALEAYPHKPRLAMKACTGPGKSAVLAWIGWNFMLTRRHPNVAATSITGDNLKANLWAELARWRSRSKLLQTQFEQTKTVIFHRKHPLTWKLEARTWSKDADAASIGNSLRGLHADYVMWLLDETGDYPLALLPICEAIFSGNPKEAHIVQAGNPWSLSSVLYVACVRGRADWYVIEITADPDDPKRTPRVSKEHAEQQIRMYGRDDPWVLVNIFGKFPPSSINSLIGPDEVAAAMKRMWREYEIGDAPRTIGVDVARYGDDKSVLVPRRGLQMYPFKKYRSLDSIQGAGQVARLADEFKADAIFVDVTGGFGAGWYDQLLQLGRSPIGVTFSNAAHDSARYFNKRTEMAFEFVEWIKRGGAMPDDSALLTQLVETTYTFKGDRVLLEPKDALKLRIRMSPDEMDACMTTFAEPVAKPQRQRPPRQQQAYNPFEELDRAAQRYSGTGSGDYDPYR